MCVCVCTHTYVGVGVGARRVLTCDPRVHHIPEGHAALLPPPSPLSSVRRGLRAGFRGKPASWERHMPLTGDSLPSPHWACKKQRMRHLRGVGEVPTFILFSRCAHWRHNVFSSGESAGFLKMVRPQEGIISPRLCPVFVLETSLTVFRGNSRPSPVLLTHTHLCSLLRGAGSGWGRWGQEQVGHLTEGDPAPDSLEEQDVAREGQALCSSTGSPPH